MAEVRKLIRQRNVEEVSDVVKKIVKQESSDLDFSDLALPLKKSTPSNNLSDYAMLIFGEEKIGKTTLASMFDSLIFAFEKGTKSVSVYDTQILTRWEMALHYLDLLEKKGAKQFPYFCIDTGHSAYDRCLEYICKRDNIKHPGKVKDYGASWKEVMLEFTAFHSRLARLGGFIVISHERTREREDRDGNKFDRIEPCFSESAENFYKAICDIVGYYSIVGDKRYLQIQPSSFIHSGHRVDGHFLTVNGEPVFRIPMGNNSQEAYQNIVKAFNNQQVNTFFHIAEKEPIAKRKVV